MSKKNKNFREFKAGNFVYFKTNTHFYYVNLERDYDEEVERIIGRGYRLPFKGVGTMKHPTSIRNISCYNIKIEQLTRTTEQEFNDILIRARDEWRLLALRGLVPEPVKRKKKRKLHRESKTKQVVVPTIEEGCWYIKCIYSEEDTPVGREFIKILSSNQQDNDCCLYYTKLDLNKELVVEYTTRLYIKPSLNKEESEIKCNIYGDIHTCTLKKVEREDIEYWAHYIIGELLGPVNVVINDQLK